LRATVWKIFLRIAEIPSSTYLEYVEMGKSSVHEKSKRPSLGDRATGASAG
jgi:hypothetical protein